MGFLQTMRDWFASPYDPAIMDRSAVTDLDVRQAAGSIVFAPSQLNKPVWSTGNPSRYVEQGWSKAPVVFACVLAIADAVATARIAVVEDTGGDEPEPAEDSDLQRLLNRPNLGHDQAEFLQVVETIASISGFCVVEKERDRLRNVIGLWPLRSDWLKPIPRRDSPPAWEYRIPGYRDPFIKEPEDVLVYTAAPDPNLGYRGTSPLAVAFRELGIENAMTDFLKAFFDRGALPVYGVIPRMPFKNQEEADAFRERMMGKYGGALNSAEPLILSAVEDVKRLGFDFDELAYPELRALSETQICTAFRVPPILVGVQAGLEQATYSNYEQARRAFYEDVVQSRWRRIDGALTRGLVPEFDDTGMLQVEFDTSQVVALQEDVNAKWQRATAALNSGGISTHTYQRLLDLEPHGPDVIYQPFSATPVVISPNGQRSRRGVTTVEVEPGVFEHTITDIDTPTMLRMLSTYASPDADPFEIRDDRTYLRFDRLTERDQTFHTRAAAQNRQYIQRFAEQLEPRMAAFFVEQGERIRGYVFGERGALYRVVDHGMKLPEISKRALEEVPWDAEAEQLRQLIEQWFTEAGTALFADLSQQLDSDLMWTGGNQYIGQLYEQLGTRIVGIHEVTRQQVEQVIVDGLAEGTSIPQMAENLTGLFEETYQNRATTIARTESQFAANVSASAAYEQAGITRAVLYDNPAHIESYGASDGLTCAQRNGLVVPVHQVPRHSSAEHPNGTMAVGPVVEG